MRVTLYLAPVVFASAALAKSKHKHHHKCREGHAHTTFVTHTITSANVTSIVPETAPTAHETFSVTLEASSTALAHSSLAKTSAAHLDTSFIPGVPSTGKTSSVTHEVTSVAQQATPEETTSHVHKTTAALVQPSAAPVATAGEPQKRFCGAPDDYEVLFGTPWIIYSMNYNYKSISGSCCTGYYGTSGSGDDQTIEWSSIWDIDPKVGTNVVKGYNFIGLTQGLETRLSDIKSIPSKVQWTVINASSIKGNHVYDFMTSDTKGDSTSSNAQELMLWLSWHGNQVPIGWAEGPVAIINGLYGKDGWKLYQGKNTSTGITVSSLLAPEDSQFGDMTGGSFEGDIKDWLMAMAEQGVYSDSTYVNVGNCGNEPYYGSVTIKNSLSLRINV